MTGIFEAILTGLLTGAIYALMASGLTLIFGVMDIINVGQGALVILGAYLSYVLSVYLHIDLFLGLIITMPVMFALGALIEWAFIRPLKVDRTMLSILVTLLDQGPIRMTDLAAHERVRTPTTTVAIRRLEKVGLVKRSRDPSDLRAVLVDITPRGRAVHGESLANRRAALAAMLSQLPESDLNTLIKALAPLERLASGESTSGPAGEPPARKQA